MGVSFTPALTPALTVALTPALSEMLEIKVLALVARLFGPLSWLVRCYAMPPRAAHQPK